MGSSPGSTLSGKTLLFGGCGWRSPKGKYGGLNGRGLDKFDACQAPSEVKNCRSNIIYVQSISFWLILDPVS